MSETEQGHSAATKPVLEDVSESTEAPKVFTRKDVRRTVPVSIHFPQLMPGIVFGFEMRLKLSQEAEDSRQEYLSLSQADQTLKQDEQNLNELCDLLVNYPTGFGDLQTQLPPKDAFKDYVKNADPEAKAFLNNLVQGAINVYWRKISPQEFRKTV